MNYFTRNHLTSSIAESDQTQIAIESGYLTVLTDEELSLVSGGLVDGTLNNSAVLSNIAALNTNINLDVSA